MRWDVAEEATRMALEGVWLPLLTPLLNRGGRDAAAPDRSRLGRVSAACQGVAALSEGAGDAKARPTIQMARWPADAFRSNLRGTL